MNSKKYKIAVNGKNLGELQNRSQPELSTEGQEEHGVIWKGGFQRGNKEQELKTEMAASDQDREREAYIVESRDRWLILRSHSAPT